MALFDALISELASKFGLGAKSGPLVSELLRYITGQPGGIAGFLDKFKTAGLGNLVTSWLGKGENLPLSTQQVDQVLGSNVISNFASKLGLGSGVISSALSYGIPKIIDLLTPDGVVPTGIPAAVSALLGGTAAPASVRRPEPVPESGGGFGKWLWPLLGLLGLLLLGWYFLTGKTDEKVVSKPAVTQTAPALLPKLALNNDDGTITVSGVVKDEATRASILDTLKAVFGVGNVKGDVNVNPNAAPASWLTNLKAAIENFKIPGLMALFEGNSINLGGLIPDVDRDKIIASLKSLFGDSYNVAPLSDQVIDVIRGAGSKTLAALAALKPGYTAADLVGALNLSIVNFATGSAQVPAYNREILKQAAAAMKTLPAGTVIEVGGHTDNTGDASANMVLSQQRAEAVRQVLVGFGVNPAMLTAKGYGSSQPVASNDTPEGRFQNRRIAYTVVR
jgi:outer membrane protein OmpA-like peptidoglycan-associated protein/uncharacterized protein YidB (DUF937 family)